MINNRLNSVQDTGSTAAGMPMGRSFYTYDRDGRLVRDARENLNMRWTIDNKIRQVQKSPTVFVRYLYDAAGNRVMKRLPNDTAEYVVRDGTPLGEDLVFVSASANVTFAFQNEPRLPDI